MQSACDPIAPQPFVFGPKSTFMATLTADRSFDGHETVIVPGDAGPQSLTLTSPRSFDIAWIGFTAATGGYYAGFSLRSVDIKVCTP